MQGEQFVANHIRPIGVSGIRKVFEMAATMKSPLDMSIGQPDFDVPDPAKQAAIQAIQNGKNGYTVTQGLAKLRDKIRQTLASELGRDPEALMVTSGVSGGLHLALTACLNPGDEVIFGDPFFVSYPHLTRLAGGRPVPVELYDDFRLHPEKIEAALTPRTRVILFNSPGNPTGIVYRQEDVRRVAQLAVQHDILIISDEIYRDLSYDGPCASPIHHAPEHVLLLRGFGKSHGMTGWRMGYAAGPAAVIREMSKLQQYTYVCAPQPAQWGTLAALDCDISPHVTDYRAKRDLVCESLSGAFEFERPGGGFYVFPKIPPGFASASHFARQAIDRRVLIIPGEVFSARDTHFRVSYAAPDDVLREGCEILRDLARSGPGA